MAWPDDFTMSHVPLVFFHVSRTTCYICATWLRLRRVGWFCASPWIFLQKSLPVKVFLFPSNQKYWWLCLLDAMEGLFCHVICLLLEFNGIHFAGKWYLLQRTAMLEISERRLKGAVQEVSGKASSTDNGEDQWDPMRIHVQCGFEHVETIHASWVCGNGLVTRRSGWTPSYGATRLTCRCLKRRTGGGGEIVAYWIIKIREATPQWYLQEKTGNQLITGPGIYGDFLCHPLSPLWAVRNTSSKWIRRRRTWFRRLSTLC